MREWSLPLFPVERHLLVAEMEKVQFILEESEIVQFLLRQFPERPSNPHALVFGHSFRDSGTVEVGDRQRDDHMVSGGGGTMFSLSEGPQQSEPTAVAFAATASAAEAVTSTSVSLAVSSKGVTETSTSSMGVASAVELSAAPVTGGTVFPTPSVGGGGQGARSCR